MGLKHHTIILVPHARARFRKWRVTTRQVVTATATLAFLALLSVFTTWTFFTNTIDRQELERVRTENEALRRTNTTFESSIRTLERQLGEFEERTRQLAIVAGLDSAIGGTEAGIGGDNLASADFGRLANRTLGLESDLALVEAQLAEREKQIASMPAIAPVKGILTSGFGYRSDPLTGSRAFHSGVDIATSPGRPVLTSADGVVIRTGRMSGLGLSVYVSHGYGLTTRYGHLSKITVEPGQRVERGDEVGRVGSTGRATGFHLHYEVLQDGRAVNPVAYLLESPSGS